MKTIPEETSLQIKDDEPSSTVVGSPNMFEMDDDSEPQSPVMPSIFTTHKDDASSFPFKLSSADALDSSLSKDNCKNEDKSSSRNLLNLSPIPFHSKRNSSFDDLSSTAKQISSTPFTSHTKSATINYEPPNSPNDFSPATPPYPDTNISSISSPRTPPLPNDKLPQHLSATPPYSNHLSPTHDDRLSSSLTPPPKTNESLSVVNEDPDLERPDSPATPPLPEELEGKLNLSSSKTEITKQDSIHIWKGVIYMPDIASFYASAFEVSGRAFNFTSDVSATMSIVGRINSQVVWDYIAETKKAGSKEILVVRFQPSNENEKIPYIALYSYLSSKKRYGVIGNCGKSVKDFYVIPLASHQPIPQVSLILC